MTGLSLRGLTVLRGKRLVLEDVSFSAPAGAVTAVLGGPGAGKTTLLAAAAGLLKPERGAVLCGGMDATKLPMRKRGLFLLAPGSMLPETITVRATLHRLAGRDGVAAIDATIEQLGLSAVAQEDAGTLSHGQALLALGAARLSSPAAILLVDEAASGLDDLSAGRLLDHLRQRAAAGGTILLATRDRQAALQADHLVLLAGGRVLQTGTPASLYAEPHSAECALLTGPANILQGQIRELRAGGFIWSGGGRFAQATGPQTLRPALGAKVTLCLRPECVVLLAPGAQADNEQQGTVTALHFAGATVKLRVATNAGAFSVSVPAWPSGRWPARGEPVRIGWPAEAACVLPG